MKLARSQISISEMQLLTCWPQNSRINLLKCVRWRLFLIFL